MGFRSGWLWVVVLVVAGLAVPLLIFLPGRTRGVDQPWEHLPERIPHKDHSALLKGPFTDGPSVTRACLECHAEAAHEVMQTAHWNWERDPVAVSWRDEPVAVGKKNVINNFCIGVQSNWEACTSCHAGYGWKDDGFDFSEEMSVDCLVCHDQSGLRCDRPQSSPGGYRRSLGAPCERPPAHEGTASWSPDGAVTSVGVGVKRA